MLYSGHFIVQDGWLCSDNREYASSYTIVTALGLLIGLLIEVVEWYEILEYTDLARPLGQIDIIT